jgi:hypothetical protein
VTCTFLSSFSSPIANNTSTFDFAFPPSPLPTFSITQLLQLRRICERWAVVRRHMHHGFYGNAPQLHHHRLHHAHLSFQSYPLPLSLSCRLTSACCPAKPHAPHWHILSPISLQPPPPPPSFHPPSTIIATSYPLHFSPNCSQPCASSTSLQPLSCSLPFPPRALMPQLQY